MNSTKPIFIAKVLFSKERMESDTVDNILKSIKETEKSLILRLVDYNILVVPIISDDSSNGIEFECFYPDKLETKDFELFKKEIEKQLIHV